EERGFRGYGADVLDHELLDGARGHRAYGARATAAVHDPGAHVVAVHAAAAPGRARGHGRAARPAPDQPAEQVLGPWPLGGATAGAVLGQEALRAVEDLAVDDSLVLTRMDLALVGELAEVDHVREVAGDRLLVPAHAAEAPAGLGVPS